MFRLHVKTVDIVQPTIPGFRHNRKRPPIVVGPILPVRHTPLNRGISHDSYAVRVRNHHRADKKSRLLDPGRTGHFAIAVQRPPTGKDRIVDGVFAARQNRGDARSHRPLADHQLAFSRNECRMADGYAGNVSDGVERSWCPVERNPKITSSWFRFAVILRLKLGCGRELKSGSGQIAAEEDAFVFAPKVETRQKTGPVK